MQCLVGNLQIDGAEGIVSELLGVFILFFLFFGRAMWDLSSLTRDLNCAPCIASLNHWTTREVP